MSNVRVSQIYLAWVEQRERSFLVFVCFQQAAPQLSWGAAAYHGSSGQHPEPSSPSLTSSRPMCTAFQTGHIFPGRTRCKVARCLQWGNKQLLLKCHWTLCSPQTYRYTNKRAHLTWWHYQCLTFIKTHLKQAKRRYHLRQNHLPGIRNLVTESAFSGNTSLLTLV